MKNQIRRDIIKGLALASVAGPWMVRNAMADDTVKVGILHSLTGTIALAEASVVDAEKLAIDEINAAGGVLGKKIVPVVEDGASDWPTFAEKARKLLDRDKVAAVFGCYTSASRKAVLPVFEQMKGLLYYPTYYEGQEQSPNILYTAHEATQQCIQACNWLLANRGKRKRLASVLRLLGLRSPPKPKSLKPPKPAPPKPPWAPAWPTCSGSSTATCWRWPH